MNISIYPFFFLAALVLLMGSCAPHPGTADAKESGSLKAPRRLLREDNMYNGYSVDSVSQLVSSANKAYADSLYKKGSVIIKEQGNNEKAIPLLKEAILYYPAHQYYSALGQALFDQKRLDEAFNAYEINGLDMASSANTGYELFQQARIAAMQHDTDLSIERIYLALTNDPSFDQNHFLTDPAFKTIRTTERFKRILTEFFKNSAESKSAFVVFSRKFTVKVLPYTIPDVSYTQDDGKVFLDPIYGGFIPGLTDGEFTRDGGGYYRPLVRFSDSTKPYSVYIYAAEYLPADSPLINYNAYAITYTAIGEVIDTLCIAENKYSQSIKATAYPDYIFRHLYTLLHKMEQGMQLIKFCYIYNAV